AVRIHAKNFSIQRVEVLGAKRTGCRAAPVAAIAGAEVELAVRTEKQVVDGVRVHVVLQTVFAGGTGQGALTAENHGLSGKGAVLVIRIRLHASNPLRPRGRTRRISRVLVNVGEIDVTGGLDV